MNNVKSILPKVTLTVLTILSFFFLYSCSEEPVSPPPPPPPPVNVPDTVSRYVWETYSSSWRDFYNVYAADTNLVYIVGNIHLMYWNGTGVGVYNLNDPNFIVLNVYGYGKDILYVSGWRTQNGIDLPIVKKVDHGVIKEIQLDTVETYIYDLLVLGPDEVWFSAFLKNAVYHYKNGAVKKYNSYTNDSINTGKFYVNENNELYLFQFQLDLSLNDYKDESLLRRDILEKRRIDSKKLYNLKFTNDTFNLLSSQCYGPSSPGCYSIFIYKCGNDALMINLIDQISIFNGYQWELHSRIDTLDDGAVHIGGISNDSLVAFTLNYGRLYTYNGIRWRLENNSPSLWFLPNLGHSNVEAKFGNIYFCHYSSLANDPGVFYIGRPNKQLKKH